MVGIQKESRMADRETNGIRRQVMKWVYPAIAVVRFYGVMVRESSNRVGKCCVSGAGSDRI